MVFERIADAALARRREAEAGIMSLFGDATAGGGPPEIDRVDIPDVEFDKMQRLAYEKEMLGLYVSDHPLMGAQAALARHVESTLTEAKEMQRRARPRRWAASSRPCQPPLHQAGRPDGHLRPRGPRGGHGGLRLPPDDDRLRPPPRGGQRRGA